MDDVSGEFRRRHFPGVGRREWNDWRWQLRHAFRSAAGFSRFLQLTDDERAALADPRRLSPVRATPYYASLMHPDNPDDPLRRCLLPVCAELTRSVGEAADPLAEESHSPVAGLVHRYPDRAVLLVNSACPVYCRYCFRSRLHARRSRPSGPRRDRWQAGLDYIAATPAVRDVLVSGGEPLLLPDAALDWLLARLHAIPHVEIVRLGAKTPMALPQRITPALVRVLKRCRPLYLSLHVTHPAEITPESARACERLANGGIPLRSQTVLLRGVNDDLATIRRLMHELLRIRVRPYYLLQCDPVAGSAHFRTPVARGIDIIEGLRGHTSGYAVPHYVIDAPGGGGKVTIQPDAIVGRDGNDLIVRTYTGKEYRYPDPPVIGRA